MRRSTTLLTLAGLLTAAALALVPASSPNADDTPPAKPGIGVATFGSGCFWCTEKDFDAVPGVLSTVSGYMGGSTAKPTYELVSTGRTGHVEVLQVTFDTSKVTYAELLHHFWRTTDVVDGGGQFCDRGNQYRPAIFAHGEDQLKAALEGKAALDAAGKLGKPIAVEIAPAQPFTAAEDYHQDFYKKEPRRYFGYRLGCGREARLDRLWGKDRLDHLKPKTN
ncbi:MAG: peptide-methionine (S)-S-oxide reductase MsrA [Hyphomicrobiaceae bacterium]|nr:peptide-methionine (S)-S-oxide reductase MsrA [Hyphomicrobiaceae bacterium]